MAKILYNIGKWSSLNGIKVILMTLLILGGLGAAALGMGISFNDDLAIPGTESEEAMKVLEKEFQSGDSGGQAYLVMKAPENETLDSAENNKLIQEALEKIQEDQAVTSVATPAELKNINPDKQIGYAVITYDTPAAEVSDESKGIVEDNLQITRDAGIQTELGGTVEFDVTTGGGSEVMGIIAAYVVLAITFTSLLVAGMPIIMALFGLGMGVLLVLIGTNFFDVPSISLTLAAMLGIAVGIDYALFIISRFRLEMKKENSVTESVAIATGTAGSAVVFAGVTVIIGLLGLVVMEIPFIGSMGIAAAAVVLGTIFVSLTLLPAILGLFGHKMAATRKNRVINLITRTDKKKAASSNKWGRFVTSKPLTVAILGIVLLVVMSVPFFHMELGLPNKGDKTLDKTERQGYELMTEGYGDGVHATLAVLAEPEGAAQEFPDKINQVVEDIGGLTHVKSVSPAMPNESGDMFIISVTPTHGPNHAETKDLVKEIRELSKSGNAELMVTGSTAINIDISQKIMDALPIFAALIILFAYLLLMVVFRSLLIPLKAVLGFVLSMAATFGFTVLVVQDGYLQDLFGLPGPTAILFLLPILSIGILFGLAMDYEVFLVSKMREVYTHTGDAKKAIFVGMKENGPIVTAAGLIMAVVFAGFILASDPIIKQMGLALTFGVLFDAFVVRLTIVPAVMTLMGKSSWYLPKWLDRILPNIDIEGTTLMTEKEKKPMVQKQPSEDLV
ncbi:MMPL family transporter [Planomicrobium sp. CPCC 101110]|uniref:MMPL family transporter n=1 Tax=Planomicrobium sp. CPCC 101110 TaxID=2599619 RepID=UPI0011B65F9A|nr:MMPL family transporter [Planomicrobium sp. CPCC 101110]TWT25763.1 MMPL family transporter [Planomicrobium sp. CPCC 101110]